MEPTTPVDKPVMIHCELLIIDVTEPINGSKDYWIIPTNLKSYLCFDSILADTLKKNIGKVCEVDTIENGNRKKIVKFYKANDSISINSKDNVSQYIPPKLIESISYCISYAIRLYEAEAPLIVLNLSKEDAKKVLEERKSRIAADAIAFFYLFLDLNNKLNNPKN